MTTTYNEKRTIGRARRIDRTISVIPASGEGRADAAPAAPEDLRGVLADALESTRAATATAERELRIAEAERSRTARALEYDLRPMTLDESDRARLRAAYAEADGIVASKRRDLEQAQTLANAVTTIADTIGTLDGDGQELANRLTATLALWQLAAVRDSRAQLRGL